MMNRHEINEKAARYLVGFREHRIILALVPYLVGSAVLATSLNDTGQQLCYDGSTMATCTAENTGDTATYPHQDGRFGRDAAATASALPKTGGGAVGFDFTALDAAGNAITPTSSAVPHPCVRDNVTGLIWEVKTDDGGLRDQDWTYTWYSADSATNGGDAGFGGSDTCGGTLPAYSNQCNTANYVTAINATSLCGATDWRLPTVRELQSIVHYGVSKPSIDLTYFPNTTANYFWSASVYPLPAYAWFASFDDGFVYAYHKSSLLPIRLVRGGRF